MKYVVVYWITDNNVCNFIFDQSSGKFRNRTNSSFFDPLSKLEDLLESNWVQVLSLLIPCADFTGSSTKYEDIRGSEVKKVEIAEFYVANGYRLCQR